LSDKETKAEPKVEHKHDETSFYCPACDQRHPAAEGHRNTICVRCGATMAPPLPRKRA